MSSHFLLSARVRTLSLAQVMRLTDQEAEQAFMMVRWHVTSGKPGCPHCGSEIVWDCRKANGAPRWRRKVCRKSFSVTSGTIFASAKLPLRDYLAAIAIFVNEVKGKAALALSRDLGVQYETAFVLAHKIREAMASELKGMHIGGEGKTVETDGDYFGGYIKPANHKENRRNVACPPIKTASARWSWWSASVAGAPPGGIQDGSGGKLVDQVTSPQGLNPHGGRSDFLERSSRAV
jgi:transposase-like protein